MQIIVVVFIREVVERFIVLVYLRLFERDLVLFLVLWDTV